MALIVGGVAIACYGLLPRDVAAQLAAAQEIVVVAARRRAADGGALAADESCW